MDAVKELLEDAGRRMSQGIEAVGRELAHLRAGRANASLVDHIKVEAYGAEMPLNQLATVSTPDATMLMISPFDKSMTAAIEKAINMSDLGLMPQSDGSLIRINVPPLTEDRRLDLLKVVKKVGEDGRALARLLVLLLDLVAAIGRRQRVASERDHDRRVGRDVRGRHPARRPLPPRQPDRHELRRGRDPLPAGRGAGVHVRDQRGRGRVRGRGRGEG